MFLMFDQSIDRNDQLYPVAYCKLAGDDGLLNVTLTNKQSSASLGMIIKYLLTFFDKSKDFSQETALY